MVDSWIFDYISNRLLIYLVSTRLLLFLLDKTDQYKRYQHIYIDFFNIIQPAGDTEWIIVGDEAHNDEKFLMSIENWFLFP